MLDIYIVSIALLALCCLGITAGLLAGVYLGKIKIVVGKIIEITGNNYSK